MTRQIERRTFTGELRAEPTDEGGIRLRGYAAVFDSEAHGEVVKRTAFNRTLAQRDDVRLLVNHDGVPLARTKSGTLRLSVDERGLVVDADLDPANPTVQELLSAMQRGDIDQMSFAFSPVDATRNDDGVRELREVVLYDVSVVTYPWYEATSAELNSLGLALAEVRAGNPLPDAARAVLDELVAALPAEERTDDPEVDEPAEEPVPAASHPARREIARLWFPAVS